MSAGLLEYTKKNGMVTVLFLLVAFVLAGTFLVLVQRLTFIHSQQAEVYLTEIAGTAAQTMHEHIVGRAGSAGSAFPSAANIAVVLDLPVFEGRGKCYLVDRAGRGISLDFKGYFPDNNIFSAVLAEAALYGTTNESLAEDFAAGRSGIVHIFARGQEMYVAYAPVSLTDYYVVIMLPKVVVNERIGNIVALVMGTLSILVIIFVVFLVSVFSLQRQMRRDALQYVRRMAALVSNIPGGVVRCADDEHWTILESSRGFIELTGYSEEEMLLRFDNKLRGLIFPEDRDESYQQQQEKRLQDSNISLEYRILRKDGSVVWVVARSQLVEGDTSPYWCSVLLDVSERKRAQDRRRIEEERYRILFEMSDCILYELDLRSGIMHTTRRFFEKFEYPLPSEQATHHPVDMNIIHPEDMAQFMSLHQSLRDGASMAEAVMRIQKHNGDWVWCHVHQTALHDVSNNCIKALGKITNVDAETRALHKLRDDVQRDAFTGLYNKTATAEMVTQALVQGSNDRGALCIIDADNFKQVNDLMGHSMGDDVLKDLAQGLGQIFRSSDIVGRVGGDEFIVFLKDIKKLRALLFKMDQVLKLFRQQICQDGKSVTISASIGIALYPKDGEDFDQLYRHADKALYRSKVQKDTYNFYDPDTDSP